MNLANKITIIRILLVPVFVLSIVYYDPLGNFRYLPFSVFLLAVLTDGIDGMIARILKQKTEFGTILDPIADKILIITALICLSAATNLPRGVKLPAWVPVLVISRDLILIFGAAIIYLIKKEIKIEPSKIGKITTFLQMATVLSIFLQYNYSYVLWTAMAFFTVLSGIGYIRKGSILLNHNQ